MGVAQGGLDLDLLDGIAWLLCMAQDALDGALAQLPHQGLLQSKTFWSNVDVPFKCNREYNPTLQYLT